MNLHENWLVKAKNDLKSAKKLMKGKDIIKDTAIYHCQQCAEKALKAFLLYNKKPLKKTHDLELLVDLCIEIDKDFDEIYDLAVTLVPYSTLFRYPDELIEPDQEDVYDAIDKAERIYSIVKEKVESK
jgi:HEPN domain-containing protein